MCRRWRWSWLIVAVLSLSVACSDDLEDESNEATEQDAGDATSDTERDASMDDGGDERDASDTADGGSDDSGGDADDTGGDEPDGTSGEDAGDAGGSGCDDGLTECGGECVDTESSSDHCGGCDNPCPDDSCSEGVCSSISMQVLEATNEARTTDSDCGSEGEFSAADALEFDPDLTEAAQVHADDMAENDFIGHTGSDDSTFSERVDRTDYTGFPVGENVAAGYPTPEDVVDGWMDSDGHCRNIMNPDADEMGAAMVENSDGQYTYYWVQVFGSR